MTTVINIGGGAGCGKSTLAAFLFGQMKTMELSVELVQEYVKSWAWEGRKIGVFDEPHIFGEQLKRESILYGKVDWIVTDRPLWLSDVYERFFSIDGISMRRCVNELLDQQKSEGVKNVDFIVERAKKYNPKGRYQTEEEAKIVDTLCRVVRPDAIEVNTVSDILRHLGIK